MAYKIKTIIPIELDLFNSILHTIKFIELRKENMAEVSEFDNTNELEEVNCEYTRRKTINQVNETLIFKNTFEEKK